MARMLPREAENGVGMNRSGLPGEESVKRFERSNGLDTSLYKTIPLPFLYSFSLYIFLYCYVWAFVCMRINHVGLNT